MSRYLILLFLPCISYANNCANISDVIRFVENEEIASMKKARECGFDFHYKNDGLINHAIQKIKKKSVHYLLDIGLNADVVLISALLDLEAANVNVLYNLSRRYRLKKHKWPSAKNWKVELSEYGLEDKNHKDYWGNSYAVSYTKKNTIVYCAYGFDGKKGGTGLNKDICSEN